MRHACSVTHWDERPSLLISLPQVLNLREAWYYGFSLSRATPVGQRVAMNRDGVVYYLHTDHLGSTSLATDVNGQEVTGSRTLYYPYGEERWNASGGTLPTDYTFTGQRNEASLGLYDYHARFYDPYLGRFISADTIVPNPGNPQDFNRYAYAADNPLRYVDPSGHTKWEPPTRQRAPQCGEFQSVCVGWWWLTEQGPQTLYFDPGDPMTQDLMEHEGVNEAREEFYQKLEAGELKNGTARGTVQPAALSGR